MVTITSPAPTLTRPSSDAGALWRGQVLADRLWALLLVLRPPDGWVAAGLLTLNMIIVVWSVEVADWAPTPSLVLVMLIAVLTALLLTRVRFWAAAVLPVGLLIGGGVVIWQMVAAAPQELQIANAAEFFERLGLWIWAARTEGISVDPLPFATGLLIASWLSGYLAGWVFFRYRNFWGVFALGAVGLLSNLTFLPDNASIYLAIYLFTGLLLVGWVQSIRSRQRWDRQGRIYDGHLGILTVSDTSLVAIVALLIAFLLPVGGQWGPANAFYNFSRSPLVHWEEDFNRLFAGLPARRPLPYRIWGDTMAFQGTINPTDTPVLQVNSPVPLYWKARSYATYSHEGWLSEGTVLKEPGWKPEHSVPNPYQERFNVTFEVIPKYDSRSLFAGGQVIGANRDIRVETFDSPRYVISPDPDSPIDSLPPVLQDAVEGFRETVAADAYAGSDAVMAVLPPKSFVLESVERDDSGRILSALIGEIVPAEPDVLAVRAAGGSAEADVPYQLTSSVSSAEPDQLRAAGDEYAPWLWARYTQLPGDMPPRVAELARDITAEAETPYDQAVAVEQYLKNNFTYNLDIDPPPFGADGVDYFLFDNRQGYSEYFGSAMTVLMRSLGVPSRMTTGYTTGHSLDGSNLYMVSDHHSHGWTEVYFPDYGWIPFEPTPGKEIPVAIPPEKARPGSTAEGSADAGDLPCEIEEECEDFESLFDDEELAATIGTTAQWTETVRAALPWLIGLGAAAVLLVLAAWVIWRWLLATPRNVTGAYRRLQRLGAMASFPMREHQTPHQWGSRLAAAMPEQQAAIQRIVNAYTRQTYSGRTPADADDSSGISEAWKTIRFPLALYALRRREV